MSDRSVLLIYTGGTIGMVQDAETGALHPFDFDHIFNEVPELKKFNIRIDSLSFDTPIDSSDMVPATWSKLARMIYDNYDRYDGFVVLHGSDTMAYTASALSFMLRNLCKPVILTGSQLPIGVIRTDGKENIITSIEIASAMKNDTPFVPEVAVYFEYHLYRGNRTTKVSASNFEAFNSPNYPVLAEAGIDIRYDFQAIRPRCEDRLQLLDSMETGITILKLFPGIDQQIVERTLTAEGLKGVILETYGSGNTPRAGWLNDALRGAIDRGIHIVNVTQCLSGYVDQGKYYNSAALEKAGVISGYDITTEAAVTKLMHLLGTKTPSTGMKEQFTTPICGEMTPNASSR